MYVIYKNISDVIDLKEGKFGLSFFQKLKHIVGAKKNPILLTILTENFITFTSNMVPITCQLLFLVTPTTLWGIIGSFAIGIIQVLPNQLLRLVTGLQKLQVAGRLGI